MCAMDHLLNETVTLQSTVGFVGAGERSFGVGVDHAARIEWMDKQLRRGKDQMIRIVARIFLRPLVAIVPNDRIIYAGINYQVERVSRPRDISARADHIEILVSEEIP